MNRETDDIDLELALRYSHRSIQTRTNNNSGAGVNASSIVDMTFAASDPLSELVWSPNKGLSLKFAECSLPENKPFLLWNVGPSNMDISPSESIRSRDVSDKKVIEDNFIVSKVKSDKDNASKAESGPIEKVKAAERSHAVWMNQIQDPHRHIEEDEMDSTTPKNIQMSDAAAELSLSDTVPGISSFAGQEIWRGVDFPPNDTDQVNLEVSSAKVLPNEFNEEKFIKDDGKTEGGAVLSPSLDVGAGLKESPWCIPQEESSTAVIPLTKLKSTAENYIEHLRTKENHGKSEGGRPSNNLDPLKAPTASGVDLYRKKGKEKALSDGDVNNRLSNDKEDSRESVESCNTARLFSKGKKRLGIQQDLVIGSKRIKNHERTLTSGVRQDSSFMNWMLNMLKGFSRSDEKESPSIALDGILTCNTGNDCGSTYMGFQTFFRSLYCPNTNILETRGYKDDHQVGEFRKLLDEKPFIEIPPLEHKLVCNKEVDQGISCLPWISPVNTSSGEEGCKKSEEKKDSISFKEKKGGSSSGSLLKHDNLIAESKRRDELPKGKAKNDITETSLVKSLWISRLSTRIPGVVWNLNSCDHAMDGAPESSANFAGIDRRVQTSTDMPMEWKGSGSRDQPAENQGEILARDGQTSMDQFETILPCSEIKNPKQMASGFAQRLDALKHFISLNQSTPTCYFCGKSGHDLRTCPEAKETEIASLIGNIGSYNVSEEFPWLCIKCFQLDHWASTCTSVFKARQKWTFEHPSMDDTGSSGIPQLNKDNTRYLNPQKTGDDIHPRSVASNKICSMGKRLQDCSSTNPVLSGKELTHKRLACSSEFRDNTARFSGDTNHKENQNLPFRNYFSKQIMDVPDGMFEAIRGLRLSRMDILKWTASHVSLSRLDGFFLRLRLGKWKAGLGGTGYYVACINGGESNKELTGNSKNSISVNVGGNKCMVGSQYISNQEFSEDELMAWWCKALKGGEKIPSEDDLKAKLENRQRLGL